MTLCNENDPIIQSNFYYQCKENWIVIKMYTNHLKSLIVIGKPDKTGNKKSKSDTFYVRRKIYEVYGCVKTNILPPTGLLLDEWKVIV